MTVMCERSLGNNNNNNKDVCRVIFKHAFDRINWVKLMVIFPDKDWRDGNCNYAW